MSLSGEGRMSWFSEHYDLLRGIHIIAVIAWMAGMLYLPRLYVYHTKAIPGGELDSALQVMEVKLLRIIINPAMILTWLFGLSLMAARPDVLGQPWMWVKLAGVLFLTGWHGFLAGARKTFAAGTNTKSEKFWRMTNELPFLAAVVMVLAVTTEFLAR
jgi:protoporphyrinogen IX oxidase